MSLAYSKRATRDLSAILDYLLEHNPNGAATVLGRVRAVVTILEAHPMSGTATDVPGVRRLLLRPYPYAVFYRIRKDDVVIMRIRHTSRRPL